MNWHDARGWLDWYRNRHADSDVVYVYDPCALRNRDKRQHLTIY